MKKRLLFLACSLFIMSYTYGVKVSPVRFDVSIAPGTSQDFVINISGTKGFNNQNLMIYASDLFMSRAGTLLFDRRESKSSCVKWIKLENDKLSIFENQSKELKYKISIPYNATPGEYYAVIMVEPLEYSNLKHKDTPLVTKIKSRVAIVIVLDVPGRSYLKKGEASDLKVLESDSLIRISSAFKNTGDIHLDVLGEAVIRSADGRTNFGKFDLNARSSAKKEAFIFPDGTRDFEGVLKRQLPAGDYKLEVSYNYGYDFKKINLSHDFSVTRKSALNEDSEEFLRIAESDLKLYIPEGGRRTKVVTLTNIDYRPLAVSVESEDWVKISPNNFILKPGQVRNVMLISTVSKYHSSQEKKTVISFKTDRGKSALLNLYVSGIKENLEEQE